MGPFLPFAVGVSTMVQKWVSKADALKNERLVNFEWLQRNEKLKLVNRSTMLPYKVCYWLHDGIAKIDVG